MYTSILRFETIKIRKETEYNMKYTEEERIAIGREIYTHEISIYEASIKYKINYYTARDYMRLYRDKNGLPPVSEDNDESKARKKQKESKKKKYGDLEQLSKDELIDEVIKARVELERAKKGYAVKGGGQEKEFINLNNLNSK